MQFSPESILLALFTGLITGLASYFGAYVKVKAEVKAATEDLRQTIQNLTETTRAVELEKARIAADTTLAGDKRKTLYAFATATQSLVHSMCWLSWDAKTRGNVRIEIAKQYDEEAHKLLPEIFSQLAVLRLLDKELHSSAYEHASRLTKLDVEFGEAIIAAENNNSEGTKMLGGLHKKSAALQFDIDTLFGGKLYQIDMANKSEGLA